MKRIIYSIFVLAIMFLTVIIQICFLNTDIFFGIKPNLLFITLGIISLWYGSYIGSFYGLVSGFLLDVMLSNKLGYYMLTFFILGLIIGLFSKSLQREKKSTSVYIIFYFTFLFSIISTILSVIFYGLEPNYIVLFTRTLLEAILNSFIVIIIHKLFLKFGEIMDIVVGEI